MLTALSYTNANAASVTFKLAQGVLSGVTVDSFKVSYQFDGEETPVMEGSGSWENYVYPRKIVVSQAGKIIGSSQSDYASNRASFVAALLVDPGTQSSSSHGTLKATYSGQTPVQATCKIVQLEPDASYESDRVTGYEVTYRVDKGYWVAQSDGTTVVKI